MIDLLDYALALSLHRNFARAAKHLGVSQPTLSRGIQQLESQLGGRLFDRTQRGAFPTPMGEVVIEAANRISRCIDELKLELRSLEGLEKADLRIGVGPIVAQTWMPEAIIGLITKHPAIDVHVSTYEWWELVPQLLNRHIELAVGEIAEDAVRLSDIIVTPLPDRPLRFFCRKGHPLSNEKNPTIEKLGNFSLASTKMPLRAAEQFSGTRLLGKLALNARCYEPHISCQTFDVCCRIIEKTDNIGIAPLAQLHRLNTNETLHIIPLDLPSLRTNYGIMHLKGRSLTPSTEAFIRQAAAAEHAYFNFPAAAQSKPPVAMKRANKKDSKASEQI